MRKVAFLSFFFLFFQVSWAQVTNAFLLFPNQFFNHYYLLNPANNSLEEKLDLSVGNRSMIGVFSGVANTYGNLKYSKISENNKQIHTLGIYFTNLRKGEYIQLNKMNLRYAWTLALSEKTFLSAGASLGLVNYKLAGSVASAGGVDNGADIGAGLWLLSESLTIGLALQQVLNTTLQPIDEKLELNRYINLSPEYKFSVGPFDYVKLRAWYLHSLTNELSQWMLSPVYSWKEKLDIGGGYDHSKGIYAYTGLENVQLGHGYFRLGISYLLLSTRKLSNNTDSAVEFSLAYRLKD
jgi:hypothetical protein